jgi:hypothetical protein
LLLAHRWPERGSIGSQLRHDGGDAFEGAEDDGKVGGGGAPRYVSPALTVHRDTQALLETRFPTKVE